MVNKFSLTLILYFLNLFLAFSQRIEGKIINSTTKDPIPFVNVYSEKFKNGTTTDIDGRFFLHLNKDDEINFSCIGYEKFSIKIDSIILRKGYLFIELHEKYQLLNEVFVEPNDSLVVSIVKKAVENRHRNNPENLNSYRYNSYNKLFSTFEGFEDDSIKKIGDSTRLTQYLSRNHLFISESYTEKKFLDPNYEKEIILANRFSGFKDPSIATLLTDFSSFSIYKDYVSILGIVFLTPLAKESWNSYEFILEDMLLRDYDTLYSIYFRPKGKINFNRLTGTINITTVNYAIENISCNSIANESLISFKIYQNYAQLEKSSFPKQLNTTLTFNEFSIKGRKLQFVYKGYIENVEENVYIPKKDFDALAVEFDPLANQRNELYWENHRNYPISKRDINTYLLYDSIKLTGTLNIDRWMSLYNWSVLGCIPVGKTNIQLNEIYKYNEYEKSRIGFGLSTNERFTNIVKFGAYIGWGTQDRALKYGGDLKTEFNSRTNSSLRLFFKNDVKESASPNISYFKSNPLFQPNSFRQLSISRMDSISSYGIEFEVKPAKYLWAKVAILNENVNPTYLYSYMESDANKNTFVTTEIDLCLYYGFGQKLIQVGQGHAFTDSKFPVIKFKMSQALPNILEGEFNFTKIEFDLLHSFLLRNFGKMSVNVNSGVVLNGAPYPYLFNGKGFNSDNFLTAFYLENNFQLMGLTEFLSDRFINLFVKQNFGSIVSFQNIKFFRPELSVIQSIGFGWLAHQENHVGLNFKTMNDGYFESGVIIDNILKFKYLNIFYIGIGTGIFVRYGSYGFQSMKDNVGAKFSFKIAF